MENRKYAKGKVIFEENEAGNCMFEILSGSVSIVAEKGTVYERKLTELKKGDIFGEMAVIEESPRSATATALEDTEVEVIRGSEVNDYFKRKPERIIEIMRHISGRIRVLTDDYMAVCRAISESNENKGKVKQKESLWTKLRAFAGIYTRKGAAIPERVKEDEEFKHAEGLGDNVFYYDKGGIIFQEGDNSGCMYDILGGKVAIYASYGKPEEKLLTTLDANKFFGEMGMIDQEIRSATAVAMEYDTYVETIYPKDLESLFKKNPEKVMQILKHLSARLRSLTVDYLTACMTAAEMVEAEEKGGQLTSDAVERVKLFCTMNIYGRYYS